MITERLAALTDAELAHLARRLGAVTIGPQALVAWWAAFGRCVAAERLARRGGRQDLREAADLALGARAAAMLLPERAGMALALGCQVARMSPGPLRDVTAALARSLHQVGAVADARLAVASGREVAL